MTAEIWKRPDVAAAFLNERSLLIPDRQRQLEVMLRVLHFMPRQPRFFLDLGTGDGILLATVLQAYPQAKGVAVDFSPLMLEQARQRLAPFGERVRIVEADLLDPAWRTQASGPFDAVISGFAIHHLPHERNACCTARFTSRCPKAASSSTPSMWPVPHRASRRCSTTP